MPDQDLILIPLTSVLHHPNAVLIATDDVNGNLLRESAALYAKIFTLEPTLIRADIGVLKEQPFEHIRQRIRELF